MRETRNARQMQTTGCLFAHFDPVRVDSWVIRVKQSTPHQYNIVWGTVYIRSWPSERHDMRCCRSTRWCMWVCGCHQVRCLYLLNNSNCPAHYIKEAIPISNDSEYNGRQIESTNCHLAGCVDGDVVAGNHKHWAAMQSVLQWTILLNDGSLGMQVDDNATIESEFLIHPLGKA